MKFPVHIPFVEAQGFELVSFDAGESELRLAARPDQLNSWQVVHGGVIMSLLDVAMAHAARSLDTESKNRPGVVTIEMKTSFMRPAQGQLTARGKLLHKTATLAFTEGSVFDASGALCAHATGTFKTIKALATSSRTIAGQTPLLPQG
jgi:uncharacterized protein (TIGR00369 family)